MSPVDDEAGAGGESPGGSPVTESHRLRRLLIAGVAGANILVLVLFGISLYQARSHYEERARTLTQHIATALDQNISSTIARIDLVLSVVVDRLEEQLAAGGIDEPAMSEFLHRQEARLPEVEAFRVSRADGLVVLGRGVERNVPVNWSDRDFFAKLREQPDAGLQIAKPLKGRVSGRHVMGFSRRYNNPDGTFAGIVAAPVDLDHLTALLSAFDIGAHGVLVLRDLDLGLITRIPPLVDKTLATVGNNSVSKDFKETVASGAQRASFYTKAGADGFARISTYRRIPHAPMMVVASVAKDDYLDGWSEEAFRTLAMGAIFLVSSLLLAAALLRLVRRAESGDRRIRDSEAFVVSVIDSLRAHIAVIDARGVIVTVNRAWRRFAEANGAGSSDKVAVGANYFEVCRQASMSDSSNGPALSNQVRDVLTGSRQDLSLEYPCHSPTAQRWFVLNVVPLQGSTKGAVMIHQDITERRAGEKALERMREEELRFKSDFLSHVSHELRSPLTAIKQFTSILIRGTAGGLNTEQLQYGGIVLKNVRQLQSMIDDLLEVTRLQSGKLTVDRAAVSVAGVAADAVNTLDMTAQAKGVLLCCDLTEDLPQAFADPVRLMQILIILLDNAVKFTPAGGTVTLTGTVQPAEPEVLLVEVRDTGCGISPASASKLFERLYQVAGQDAGSRKGLGLGLYICKELVALQGGRIWLTSEPGKGSTFSFTLPRFRIGRVLAPLVRHGQWPAGPGALLTLRFGSEGTAPRRAPGPDWASETRNLIQPCLLPERELLLPEGGTTGGAPAGDSFFVAVFADEHRRQALADRLRKQFELTRSAGDAGCTLSLSYRLLPDFSRDTGSSLQEDLDAMATRLQDAARTHDLEVVHD